MPITIGTGVGNKTLTEVHVGAGVGNKQVTEVWVGTSGGNKLVYQLADPNPDAVNWADITGDADGSAKLNANQTISGIDVTITITASNSGGAALSYSKNGGGFTAYSGGISMSNGDTLRWGVASASGSSGTITVTNATTGATLDTFTYDLLEPL